MLNKSVTFGFLVLSVFALGISKPAQSPAYSFVLLGTGILLLYFLVFPPGKIKSNQDSYNQFSIKFLLISGLLFRLFFIFFPLSDDVNRYAWEGKMIAKGYNPYQSPPVQFGAYNFSEIPITRKIAMFREIESVQATTEHETGEYKEDDGLADLFNRALLLNNLHDRLRNKNFKVENLSDLNKILEIIKKENPPKGGSRIRQLNRKILHFYFPELKDSVFEGINHNNIITIYPPFGLLVFTALSGISYSLVTFKIFFILCDLLNFALLIILLRKFGKPVTWAALYGWNPFVLVYGVGEGHLDVLHLFLALVSLYFFFVTPLKYAWSGFLILGLAVMTKYLSVVLLPFVITRNNFRTIIFFFLPLLLFLPFLNENMFSGMGEFSGIMHHNDFFPRFIRHFLNPDREIYQALMIFLGITGVGWCWFFFQDTAFRGVVRSWMWLLFCLPLLHPWYLIPVMAFLVFYPNRAWLLFSWLCGLQFFVLNYQETHEGAWMEFPMLFWLTWGPFLLLLFWDSSRKVCLWREGGKVPGSLDIVIPILGEGANIENLLGILKREIEIIYQDSELMKNFIEVSGNTPRIQVIIAEYGHNNLVAQRIREYGWKYISCPDKGRGNQILEGIREGDGELVLMLHADSIIREGGLKIFMREILRDPDICWGVLGHHYEVRSFRLRFIEFLNTIRVRWMNIAFGDQGIFVKRNTLEKVKFPSIPLMEDMEISLRLYPYPFKKCFNGLLIGSSRRWQKKKFVKSVFYVLYLCIKFMLLRKLGKDIRATSNEMYKRYYS